MPNLEGKRITKKEYYESHKACPDCDNTILQVSLVGTVDDGEHDFMDRFNTAKCKCGWRGKVDDLIESLIS